MFGLGKLEGLILLLVIVILLFGAKKLPDFTRNLTESIKEIRKGFRDDKGPADGKASDK